MLGEASKSLGVIGMIFKTNPQRFSHKAPTIEELALQIDRKLETPEEPIRMGAKKNRDTRRDDTVRWDSDVYTLAWSSDDAVQYCIYRAAKNDGVTLVGEWGAENG